MKSSDEILVQRLKRGDREAQCELYSRHAGSLLSIALRYVGSRAEAEDLLHDIFIKVFDSIKGFTPRGEGSLSAWLKRVVINAALEHLRRDKRHKLVPLIDSDADPTNEEELTESIVEAIPQEVLLQYIAELPDGYRATFNLFCIEGYSHKEIAKELGINEKSSSSQLLRAKRTLAARVKKYIAANG